MSSFVLSSHLVALDTFILKQGSKTRRKQVSRTNYAVVIIRAYSRVVE